MKSRDFLRSVRAQRFDRSAGDAPSLGRVARVPGTGTSKGIRRRKRRGESGRGDRSRNNRRKVVYTWSALLALTALGILGSTLWFGLRREANRDEGGRVDDAPPLLEERVVSKFESPSEEEALKLVKGGLKVRDPGNVQSFFRLGSASPGQVVDYLRNLEKTDGVIVRYDWLSSMDANGLLIDGVLVNTMLSGKPGNRLALLTPDDKGKWLIDFEAFARMVTPSWHELLENPSASGTVRVIVAKDSYFNGPFRDESKWACYGMATPDTEGVMMGYCRKGTPQAAAMEVVIDSSKDAVEGPSSLNRATLEVRRIEGAAARQFEITRVLAEDWVRSAKAFDENFK